MSALQDKIVEFKGKDKANKKRAKPDHDSFSKDGNEERKQGERAPDEEQKDRSPAGKRIFTFGGGAIANSNASSHSLVSDSWTKPALARNSNQAAERISGMNTRSQFFTGLGSSRSPNMLISQSNFDSNIDTPRQIEEEQKPVDEATIENSNIDKNDISPLRNIEL